MKLNKSDKNMRNDRNTYSYLTVQFITLIRIPLSIVFSIILLSSKNFKSVFIICFFVLLVTELTDWFDGRIARRFKVASEFGAMLDPYADSLSRLIVFWSLASKDLTIFLVPLVMALRDITVAYSRIVLAQRGQSVSARMSGKIKAVIQSFGAFFLLLGPYYWESVGFWSYYAVSWTVLSATLLSAVEYVRDALLALRKK